jgi:hypothetical protein
MSNGVELNLCKSFQDNELELKKSLFHAPYSIANLGEKCIRFLKDRLIAMDD